MSNGESKIAIFKARLCCGFAIALRALFRVIRRCDFSRTPFVIASEHNVRAWQSTVCEARIMRILCRSIASLTLAMTRGNMSRNFHCHVERQRNISIHHCEQAQQTQNLADSKSHAFA